MFLILSVASKRDAAYTDGLARQTHSNYDSFPLDRVGNAGNGGAHHCGGPSSRFGEARCGADHSVGSSKVHPGLRRLRQKRDGYGQ